MAKHGEPEPSRWKRETWEQAREQQPERRERFATPSGIECQPLYGTAPDGGFPGEFSLTLGTDRRSLTTMHHRAPSIERQVARTMRSVSDPEIRITPRTPPPGGDAMAAIVPAMGVVSASCERRPRTDRRLRGGGGPAGAALPARAP